MTDFAFEAVWSFLIAMSLGMLLSAAYLLNP